MSVSLKATRPLAFPEEWNEIESIGYQLESLVAMTLLGDDATVFIGNAARDGRGCCEFYLPDHPRVRSAITAEIAKQIADLHRHLREAFGVEVVSS